MLEVFDADVGDKVVVDKAFAVIDLPFCTVLERFFLFRVDDTILFAIRELVVLDAITLTTSSLSRSPS
jgi:hypothetical protein